MALTGGNQLREVKMVVLHSCIGLVAGLSETGVLQPNYYHHGEGQGWWWSLDFVKCFAAECKQSNHVK